MILFSEGQVEVLKDLGVDFNGEVQHAIRERETGDVFIAVCEPDHDEWFHNGNIICEYVVAEPTCNQQDMVCIVSRKTYQLYGDQWIQHVRDLACAPVGSMVCVDAGSFGLGRAVYYITHHDDKGAWGYHVEGAIREATVADVA